MPADDHLIRIPESDRTFDRRRILFVVLSFMAMSMMALSSVNVVLTAIEADLGADAGELQWVLTGYALIFGLVLVPAGRLGDAVGRSALFMVGAVIFIVASLGCGLATDPLQLNIARVIQGLGAGIAGPQITGMIQQYFDGRARAIAFGYLGLVISASVTVGPLLAGVIMAGLGPDAGWRWTFLVNTPFGLLAMALAVYWLPFSTERARWRARRRGLPRIDLDPIGTVLLMLTVLSLMVPFMVRGRPEIWLVLVIAPVALYAFVRWERRYRTKGREPMVDLGLFSFRSFSNQTRISAILFAGQTPSFVLLALYVQSGLGGTAFQAGLVGAPATVSSAITSVVASRHALVRGRAMIIIGLGLMVLGVLGSIVVAQWQARFGIGYGWLAVPLVLNGVGMGLFTAINQTLGLQDVPPVRGGTASGVKMTTERVGGAAGIAIITGIFFAAAATMSWAAAFGIGYAVIAVTIGIALVMAVLDRRQHHAPGSSTASGVQPVVTGPDTPEETG